MKTLSKCIAFIMLVILQTSCLKSGLEELETYDQSDITNIRFEYRWWDETGKRLRVMEMEVNKSIDNNTKQIYCSIKVPTANQTFTEEIRNQVSLHTLAVNVDASTAARITPIGNAPVMGTFPADFSTKEFVYSVMAGNGNKTNWTIKITDFIK